MRVCARAFVAVVTSRGQRGSLQFLLSASSPMTRPQRGAQTNTTDLISCCFSPFFCEESFCAAATSKAVAHAAERF